jgi:glycosyltransferase involved in cell wall biosynthesis
MQWVSLLISSYNTPDRYLKECFHTIFNQNDLGISFKIEIVLINDGSESFYTEIIESNLKIWETKSEFIKIKYIKMHTNKGLSYCLHHGVLECSYDLIFRMDADDYMDKNRIKKQLDFMNNEPTCVLLGTNIISFATNNNNVRRRVEKTEHSTRLTWEEYKKTKKQWIMNHPTLCFRKYAILEVGNYNENFKEPFEDLDLELRILKKYGFICNLPEVLLFYRIHPNQITQQSRDKPKIIEELISNMIENIINNF